MRDRDENTTSPRFEIAEICAMTPSEVRTHIRDDRRRSQQQHGASCGCWLCRGN